MTSAAIRVAVASAVLAACGETDLEK